MSLLKKKIITFTLKDILKIWLAYGLYKEFERQIMRLYGKQINHKLNEYKLKLESKTDLTTNDPLYPHINALREILIAKPDHMFVFPDGSAVAGLNNEDFPIVILAPKSLNFNDMSDEEINQFIEEKLTKDNLRSVPQNN